MPDSATMVRGEGAAGKAVRTEAARPARRAFFSSRYAVAVVIMGLAALSLHGLAAWAGVHFRKQAVPLKKPLFQMSIERFKPLYDLHPVQEPPLSQEMLDPLGTDEYLNWRLVNRTVEANKSTRLAHVFVTYFTGKPDQVPHVPEECLQASGLLLLSDTVETLTVPGIGAPGDQLSVRMLDFELPSPERSLLGASTRKMTVLYFFVVNGQYLKTRTEVRRAHMNPFDRYAYYAKVELRFSSDAGGRNETWADRETTGTAAPPLLQKLLTALREDHFQDWETWTRQAGQSIGGASASGGR